MDNGNGYPVIDGEWDDDGPLNGNNDADQSTYVSTQAGASQSTLHFLRLSSSYFGSGSTSQWRTTIVGLVDLYDTEFVHFKNFVVRSYSIYCDTRFYKSGEVYDDGTSSVSGTVADDFTGTLRPLGSYYDIGAFEVK